MAKRIKREKKKKKKIGAVHGSRTAQALLDWVQSDDLMPDHVSEPTALGHEIRENPIHFFLFSFSPTANSELPYLKFNDFKKIKF